MLFSLRDIEKEKKKNARFVNNNFGNPLFFSTKSCEEENY